jgi:hypothetical protein
MRYKNVQATGHLRAGWRSRDFGLKKSDLVVSASDL